MRVEVHGDGDDDLDLAWAADVDWPTKVRLFGEATVARGQAYAHAGTVSDLTFRYGGQEVTAEVRGSGGRAYLTWVTAPGDGPGASGRLTGGCTCPVQVRCKHVVAVIEVVATLAGTLTASPPAWEATLASLVGGDDGAAERAGLPVALALEVVTPRSGRFAVVTVPRLRLRPVVCGATGNWIKTGASWRDLEYGYQRGRMVAAHREALLDLLQLARARQRSMYSSTDQSMHLDELGSAVWSRLADLCRAGVQLVQLGKAAGQVSLAPEPALFVVDASRDTDGGQVVMRARLRLASGEELGAEDVVLTGDPAHGLWISRGTDLVLASLERPMAATARSWFEQGTAVTVPAADVPRMLSTYYPALRRRVTLESADDTVVAPQVHPPRLALRATFGADHLLDLQWSFHYQVGDDVRTAPLAPDPADAVRDGRAEQALLDGLTELDAVPGLASVAGGTRRLVARSTLTGWQTATFAQDVLPPLQARTDVDVVVHGTLLDYQESAEAPRVEIAVRDDEGSSDWFSLSVVVKLGEREVPFLALFEALARDDDQMLLSDGTWFGLDQPELQQLRGLIEQSRDLVDAEPGTLRVTVHQAGLWEELVSLGVVTQQSERWARTVGALLDIGSRPAPDVPPGLKAELRDYQREGYQWLSMLWDCGLGGILADDMGLGKTLQTLAVVERARSEGTLTEPVLVVAPTSVVATWASEAARFAPDLDVVAITETERRRGTSLAELAAGAHIVVTSYALLRIEDAAYCATRWSALVLDEAQFVKNHRTATYQCARRVQAPVKLAITGTPLENSLMDLWSLLSIVAPGLFADPDHFTRTYRIPIEAGQAPELLQAVRRRIRPLMLRRTKEQVAPELPPKQEQVLSIALNPQHAKIYQTHLQRERQRVLGMLGDINRHRIAILRSLTILRQLSLDASLVDATYAGRVRSSKVDALMEHLEEVAAEGHRALVFSQFTGFLKIVRAALDEAGIEYAYLDGRTRDRPRRIAEFKDGTAPVFLISLKAGGFGLNLTEADYVFVLDPWWNPAAELQAVDRTHRIGQDKTVMVYRMVSADTIEEKVVALQQRKRDLFAQVVDGGDALSGPMSADDIRALLGQ